MNKFIIGFYLVLHVLIVGCQTDESFLENLLNRVEKLERKDAESALKQKELEDKVNLYSGLTQRLRKELKEKDVVIDDMKQSLRDFEGIVQKLQIKEQEGIVDANEESVKTVKEGMDAPVANYSRSLHHLSKRRISSALQKKPDFRNGAPFSSKRQTIDQGDVVAFHAINDHGEIAHVGIGQNILFNKVLLNLQGGFHPQHGLFIAPTAGLYIFSTSILNHSDQATSLFAADLVKNGDLLGRTYGHGNPSYHDQGSVTVISVIAAGDEVWVRLYCCADASLYGGYYTTFTGALLSGM